MNETICKFMPVKNYYGNIKTVNFVYETELEKLKQPFMREIYYIHLVTNGSGKLKINFCEYELKPGYIFFTFPGCPYELESNESLRFIYISFLGTSVSQVLENLSITMDNPVFKGFNNIMEFWFSSILRINSENGNFIAESVLLHTLSFFKNTNKESDIKLPSENIVNMIVDYLDSNYTDPDMSLKKVSVVFSYTEKYISHVFKEKMKIGFNQYLNSQRIQHARELLESEKYSISEIAKICGYRDALYFSKVFKKRQGFTPNELKKQQQ